VHSRNKYSEKLELYALKPLIKVLTGMRRVGNFREDHEGIRWMNVREFAQSFAV
jgi:hypothetical protein